jgi:DNA modification methylase
MAAGSVHCCVTSPPYWGLRDYGLPKTIWGGDPNHEHEWSSVIRHRSSGGPQVPQTKWTNNDSLVVAQRDTSSDFCDCGAWRGCLGLEPTPELYVEHLVIVFREVRRVLRDDGTLWLNLGDSYSSKPTGPNPGGFQGA